MTNDTLDDARKTTEEERVPRNKCPNPNSSASFLHPRSGFNVDSYDQ